MTTHPAWDGLGLTGDEVFDLSPACCFSGDATSAALSTDLRALDLVERRSTTGESAAFSVALVLRRGII
jgi:hypothetical protein